MHYAATGYRDQSELVAQHARQTYSALNVTRFPGPIKLVV